MGLVLGLVLNLALNLALGGSVIAPSNAQTPRPATSPAISPSPSSSPGPTSPPLERRDPKAVSKTSIPKIDLKAIAKPQRAPVAISIDACSGSPMWAKVPLRDEPAKSAKNSKALSKTHRSPASKFEQKTVHPRSG
ncbi:MAG: hypothetical protein HC771_02355 [Synechococcales cyanobacterium CRU_2_2]|nr:hypothetical protein [Synechococcales cyanobacterium CRU_2_2]